MKKNDFIKKSMFLLTLAIGIAGCATDKKEKKDEMVEDPLKTKTDYYIVGTVSDSKQVLDGVTVAIADTENSTITEKGVYSLTVGEAKSYNLKFSAKDMQTVEANVSIPAGSANRSQVIVNVRLTKKPVVNQEEAKTGEEDKEVVVKAPSVDEAVKESATITLPAAAATGVEVAAVVYEKAEVADATTKKVTVSNILIETKPAEATAAKDFYIAVANPGEEEEYLNTEKMEAVKEGATTRASGFNIEFKDKSYIFRIPQGTKIAGNYNLKFNFDKQITKETGDYNSVNGKNGIIKIENRNYSAMTNVKLTLKAKYGWEYEIAPQQALTAAGASNKLAEVIGKYIESTEGKGGVAYYITKELTTSISGNHVLFFGSKSKIETKTYTFEIVVNNRKQNVVVKTKCYNGYTEEYTNAPISQHSGGGTGE